MSDAAVHLHLEHDARRGRLSIGGQRYLLIRPQTLAPLCLLCDPAVQWGLEEGGREGGRLAAESVLARGSRGREAFEALLAMGGQIGWGTMTLVEWAPGRVLVEVRHSPWAEAASGAGAHVCHLTRGVLAGMVARIEGRAVGAEEIVCAAGGGPVCRFEVRR